MPDRELVVHRFKTTTFTAETTRCERFLPDALRTLLRARYEVGAIGLWDLTLVNAWFEDCDRDFNQVLESWGGLAYLMAQDCLPLLAMIGELAKEEVVLGKYARSSYA